MTAIPTGLAALRDPRVTDAYTLRYLYRNPDALLSGTDILYAVLTARKYDCMSLVQYVFIHNFSDGPEFAADDNERFTHHWCALAAAFIMEDASAFQDISKWLMFQGPSFSRITMDLREDDLGTATTILPKWIAPVLRIYQDSAHDQLIETMPHPPTLCLQEEFMKKQGKEWSCPMRNRISNALYTGVFDADLSKRKEITKDSTLFDLTYYTFLPNADQLRYIVGGDRHGCAIYHMAREASEWGGYEQMRRKICCFQGFCVRCSRTLHPSVLPEDWDETVEEHGVQDKRYARDIASYMLECPHWDDEEKEFV